MDALIAFEKHIGVNDGTFNVLLYPYDWRLQLIQDSRFEKYKNPTWEFVSFTDSKGRHRTTATETVTLKREEVYGFLKARFPDRDCRAEIIKEVKERVGEIVKDTS